MKNLYLLLLLLFSSFSAISQSESATNEILVIDLNSTLTIEGENLGEIAFKEKGLTMRCTYEDVIETLKRKAQQKGANVIKITEHKSPDAWSSCHRVKANMYKAFDPSKYETAFIWSANRKLKWNDFKSESNSSGNPAMHAVSHCEIAFDASIPNAFSKPRYNVRTRFNCNKSWVNDSTKVGTLLAHEQCHFDLCELYARKLRKALQEGRLTVATLSSESQIIFQQVYDDYWKRQEEYDEQTKHGIINEKQKIWENTVAAELEQLNEYARN